MKAVANGEASKRPRKRKQPADDQRPRMTRELAEKWAFGDPAKGPIDVVAFLRTLKK